MKYLIAYIKYFYNLIKTFFKKIINRKISQTVFYNFVKQENSVPWEKISEWQKREQFKPPETRLSKIVKPKELSKLMKKIITKDVLYKKDLALYGKTEYWSATDESLKHGFGDCEDQANVFMRFAIDKLKLDKSIIWSIYVKDLKNETFHVMPAVKIEYGIDKIDLNNFYLIDNGNYFVGVIKASDIQKYADLSVLKIYNFDTQLDVYRYS